MSALEELITKAKALQAEGHTPGQISDELGLSMETVTWLLTQPKGMEAPKDVHIDWTAVGSHGTLLSDMAMMMLKRFLYLAEEGAVRPGAAEIPDTVVIFAPRHRAGGANWAVSPYKTWGLPFGALEADLDWAEQFIETVRRFEFDETPHKHEHAIEVQLPIIARLRPDVKIVGITMVGGLLLSQVLTLFTTPVVYLAFDRSARWVARRGRAA